MAIKLTHGVPSAPMPGQSWTKPIGSSPWQRPPQFVDPRQAAEELWKRIMQKDNFVSMIALLKAGTPVTTITLSIIMNGVAGGMFSIDVAMLIKDVVASMIQTIAEKAKINYRTNVDNMQPGQAQFNQIMNNKQSLDRSMRMPNNSATKNPFSSINVPPPSNSGGLMSQPQGMNLNG